jgi:hypothetical protein
MAAYVRVVTPGPKPSSAGGEVTWARSHLANKRNLPASIQIAAAKQKLLRSSAIGFRSHDASVAVQGDHPAPAN